MAINQLKTGALLSYLLIGLSSFISILYTPIMLRLLGQSEYGLYSLVGSVVAYLGLFNFGFGSAYIKYFSVYKTANDTVGLARLNGMFLMIFSALGALAVAAGVVLVVNSDAVFGNELTVDELAKAKILMLIMVVNTAFTFPTIVFNSYVSANEKFIFQKTLLIIKTIANPFVIIPVLLMGYGSVGMAVIITVLSLVVELINIWFCFRKADMRFKVITSAQKILPNETFTFTYNGKTETLTSGADGTMLLPAIAINTEVKAYQISGSDEINLHRFICAKDTSEYLIVIKVPEEVVVAPEVPKVYDMKFKVVDNTGELVTNAKIVVTFNKQTKTLFTDEQGFAVLPNVEPGTQVKVKATGKKNKKK